MKDFGGLENGYIVLSTSDVAIGGTLNPDASGNQKFAVTALVVNGTVNAATTGTYRAYLVDGTEVKQRCGRVVIAEPIPVPRLTALTVAGTTILTQGSSKQIDENSALAGTIANRAQLSSGFVVLSASSVPVGGSLNPDASGNKKFAISADAISGTVDASTVGTLHAYLVDGTSVLQKCGDVVIVAPHAEVTALIANGTDIVSAEAGKSTTDGNVSGTYNAQKVNLLTHPRIVYSSSLNVAVGSQVSGADSFAVVNGTSQAFSLTGIADGQYRCYLIDATAANANDGTVVQVMGTITKTGAEFSNVTLNSQAWNGDKSNIPYSNVTVSGTSGVAGIDMAALLKSNSQPQVGQNYPVGTTKIATQAGNPFTINASSLADGSRYYLVVGRDAGNNQITVDAVYEYYFTTQSDD